MMPSVQSRVSIFSTISAIVHPTAPPMWKEPSPSGHVSAVQPFAAMIAARSTTPARRSNSVPFVQFSAERKRPRMPTTSPSHGPRLPKMPGHRTLLPHSQTSATRRMLKKVLCDESKWLSMNVSAMNLSKKYSSGTRSDSAISWKTKTKAMYSMNWTLVRLRKSVIAVIARTTGFFDGSGSGTTGAAPLFCRMTGDGAPGGCE
mmetsp:Transcript_85742/g.256836  ORF Transcript_85742/g.256836 Transcript_85742/m.256836 type:complete len:203 (+) Transcript_85742:518-1126(+)